ncbi:hypothetical protein [Telmatospirillum sp.]|uniref:hypothetical protein n=1 Tax=Telmatospirillum sp. TaxID=2079197 RepID=UPI00284FE970|nr:hypothetical protein [Telmatospirillum sp.]MDR3438156.1 hypothetical protein [Telmatospirillum sp.]
MSEEIPLKITGHTELLGLIAYPIRHSSSPRVHNLALAKLGLEYAYLAFEVGQEDLKGAVEALRTLKVRGSNVSMPNKLPIVQYLDKISPAVEITGAVNTVINDSGVLTGETTDGIGQVAALREQGQEVTGRIVTLMGCGGAGSAVAAQLALEGVKELHIFNIADGFRAGAEKLVKKIRDKTSVTTTLTDLHDVDAFRATVAKSSILINATKVGMADMKGQSPLPDVSVLRKDLFVSDAIYSPLKTRLLEQAEAAGCKYMNGIGMMLHQAAASFKMWTGKDMPLDYVKEHLFQ